MDLLNLSWPAVSHSCSFSLCPSISTIFSLKSRPIVASVFIGKRPAQNLKDRQVFPTPLSPKTMILKLRGLARAWGDLTGCGGVAVVCCSEVSVMVVLSFNRALEILDSSLCALDILNIGYYLL